MTEDMIQWIDGFLLGDGGINFSQHKKKGRFCIGSKYQEWTEYAMSKFSAYMLSNIWVRKNIDKKHPNPIYYQRTMFHRDIGEQAQRWYPNNIKIIPCDVQITPQSVLLWYLGDGKLVNHNTISIATCSFDVDSIQNILIKKLENHGIYCNINWWKKYPYVVVQRKSVGTFFDFIGKNSPIKCYDYKFDFDEWYSLKRISDIAQNQQEIWRAQSYCKTNKIPYTKSPGGKFFLFNEEQAEILRNKLRHG